MYPNAKLPEIRVLSRKKHQSKAGADIRRFFVYLALPQIAKIS
jgi:hypothetical protein